MTVYRRVTQTDKQNEKGQFRGGLWVEDSGERVLLCWCDHRHWHRSHNRVYPNKPPPPVFKNTRGRAHVQTRAHTRAVHTRKFFTYTRPHTYILYINSHTQTNKRTDGLRRRWRRRRPFNPFAGLAYKLLL